MEPENNMSFEDSENFAGSDNLSIKQIVLKQLQKCVEEGSKEKRGGGYRKRIFNNEVLEIFVPNQREVFVNNVKMLWILVLPYHAKTDIIKESKKDIDRRLEELRDTTDTELNRKYRWTPEQTLHGIIDRRINIERIKNTYALTVQKHATNYRERSTVELYHELLIAISHLLESLDYFEEAGFRG